MLHPDYQYTPQAGHGDGLDDRLRASSTWCSARASWAAARWPGGMPLYKYVANRVLTLVQNLLIGQKLSEYHTGYRALSRAVLETLPLLACSDDFVFDNQMLAQAIYFGFRIGEISCPTKYFAEASSINFRRSVVYGLGVLRTSAAFRLHKHGLVRSALFSGDAQTRLVAVAGTAGVSARPAAGGGLLLACVLLALLAAGVAATQFLPPERARRPAPLLLALGGLGIVGTLAFAALQVVVALSGVLPAALLGVAAGALYGLPAGLRAGGGEHADRRRGWPSCSPARCGGRRSRGCCTAAGGCAISTASWRAAAGGW